MAFQTISCIGSDAVSTANAVTTLTNTIPACQAGDLILWHVNGNATALAQVNHASFSQWAPIVKNGGNAGAWILYRFADATDAAGGNTYTLTGLVSGKWNGLITVYRGVDFDHPKDANPTATGGTVQAITTVTANAWVVTHGRAQSASGFTTSTWTSSSGTMRAQTTGLQAGATNSTAGTCDQVQAAAGTVTPNLAVNGAPTIQVFYTSALRPATIASDAAGSTVFQQVMSVGAAVPEADTGSGTGTMAVAAAVPEADSGLGADSMSVAVALPTVTDAGHGVDAMLAVILDLILLRRQTPSRARANNMTFKWAEPGWDGSAFRAGPLGNAVWNLLRQTMMEGAGTLVTTVTSYAVDMDTDRVVVGNGSAITVTLPNAAGTGMTGRRFSVTNKHSTALTVASAGGNIGSGATDSLVQWAGREYVSDGTQWLTI